MYLYRAMQNPRQTDEQTAHSHDIITATRDLSLYQVPRLILQPRYTAVPLLVSQCKPPRAKEYRVEYEFRALIGEPAADASDRV